MALDTAPKLRRKRRAAWKIETTTGSAIAIGASDGTTPVFNPDMKFQTEKVEREEQGSLAQPRQGRGARGAQFTFETELYGGGASAPAGIDALLRACGMQVSTGVYTPLDGAIETLTMGLYRDGRLKKMAGAMGTWTLKLRRGQAPRVEWNFRGVQAPPTDTALISPTFDSTIAPRVTSVFTLGGTAYRVPNVDVEFGNTVILREDVTGVDSASEATGYRCAYITQRVTRVRAAPEAQSLASIDWDDYARDATTLAFAATIGDTAGNKWTLAMPALQLDEDPSDEDREGVMADALNFIATDVAGTPELTLTHVGS